MTKKELVELLNRYPDDYMVFKRYTYPCFYNGKTVMEKSTDSIYTACSEEIDGKLAIFII